MIKIRLSDGGIYDLNEDDELITVRKTDHGDIREARYMPHTFPDLPSGTVVKIKGITMDTNGRAWLKCETPSGVIYKLNSTHLSLY